VKRLKRDFYARPVLTVARECIGKILVHDSNEGLVHGRIVEAEAYRGPDDLAAHSAGGRRTARTEVMYGPAGHAYLFFVYGMHWNFNVVTGEAGQPHAVLIRAVEPLSGLELMATRRGLSADRVELTNGPGKVCQAFALARQHYGLDLCVSPKLFLADAPKVKVARSARVGVDYAGSWADKPWRFFEPGNRYVSRARVSSGANLPRR
jgi:DNA-3-methyladenine glycosylase